VDEEFEFQDDPGLSGCLYVIDEAGVAGFDAQGWNTSEGRAPRGVECSWYLDQQRKFGDDVVASTNGRRPSAIAKPFRDKAHVFVKLKNGYLQQFGIFKGQGKFTARHFTQEPDAKDSEPFKIETWTMDETGLAACYRTQDGVGVEGVQADIGKRAKGIPILWAIPLAIGLAAVLAIGIPALISRYLGVMGSKVGAEVSGTVASVAQKTAEVTGAAKLVPDFQVNAAGVPAPVHTPRWEPAPAPGVTVVGVTQAGGRVNVSLSDGRVLTEAEDYLRIERAWVESPRGVRYYFRRSVAGGGMPAPVAPAPGTASLASSLPSNPLESQGTGRAGPPGASSSSYSEAVVPTPESAAAASRISALGIIPAVGQSAQSPRANQAAPRAGKAP